MYWICPCSSLFSKTNESPLNLNIRPNKICPEISVGPAMALPGKTWCCRLFLLYLSHNSDRQILSLLSAYHRLAPGSLSNLTKVKFLDSLLQEVFIESQWPCSLLICRTDEGPLNLNIILNIPQVLSNMTRITIAWFTSTRGVYLTSDCTPGQTIFIRTKAGGLGWWREWRS